jgi:hypothetical protein
VHFERDADGNEVVQPGDEEVPVDTFSLNKPSDIDASNSNLADPDPMTVVNDKVQKRVLDQWCFAEHHEPQILLQVNQ